MKESSIIIDPLMQLPGIQPEQLMQMSLPTIPTDVNIPDESGDTLTHSDARSYSISGMPVAVDLLSIINSNLLIIRIFSQYFVSKSANFVQKFATKWDCPLDQESFLYPETYLIGILIRTFFIKFIYKTIQKNFVRVPDN
jgi:hypothetical protein